MNLGFDFPCYLLSTEKRQIFKNLLIISSAASFPDGVFEEPGLRLVAAREERKGAARRWSGIAAYCEAEEKFSLGFVEGVNTKIRVIQRREYGLRDEEYPSPKSPYLRAARDLKWSHSTNSITR
jgi:hypothetical protein